MHLRAYVKRVYQKGWRCLGLCDATSKHLAAPPANRNTFSPQCMAKRVAIIWLWSGGKSLPNHKTSNGTSFLNPGILSVKFGKFWRITSCLWRRGMRSSRAFVVLKRAFGAEIANDLSTNPRLVLHHLQVRTFLLVQSMEIFSTDLLWLSGVWERRNRQSIRSVSEDKLFVN